MSDIKRKRKEDGPPDSRKKTVTWAKGTKTHIGPREDTGCIKVLLENWLIKKDKSWECMRPFLGGAGLQSLPERLKDLRLRILAASKENRTTPLLPEGGSSVHFGIEYASHLEDVIVMIRRFGYLSQELQESLCDGKYCLDFAETLEELTSIIVVSEPLS